MIVPFVATSDKTLVATNNTTRLTTCSLQRRVASLLGVVAPKLTLIFMFAGPERVQCAQIFRIKRDQTNIYIVPGVVNCFSCALDTMGNVTWQVGLGGDLVPALSPLALAFSIEIVDNFLVIAMPESYVRPGTAGRQDIVCISLLGSQSLEARLASPSKNG